MRWRPVIKIVVMAAAADSPLPDMVAAADTRWPAPPVAEMDRLATPALDADRPATPVAVVLSSVPAAAVTTAADRFITMPRSTTAALAMATVNARAMVFPLSAP